MIAEQQLASIILYVERVGLSEQTVITLRKEYPGIHLTYAFDDDMVAMSVPNECQGFNVYYVDSSEHCSKLTSSLDTATGLVLAEVVEDW
jgi:hypothetical protein